MKFKMRVIITTLCVAVACQRGVNAQEARSPSPSEPEIRAKGEAYSAASATKWDAQVVKNDLTDTNDVTVDSIQTNGSNVVAEISGRCVGVGPVFEATITNREGDGVEVSGNKDFASGQMRINDEPPQATSLRRINNYTNNLRLILLDKKPDLPGNLAFSLLKMETNIFPASGVWRALFEVNTSHGSIIIKIPMFNAAVQKLIASCKTD